MKCIQWVSWGALALAAWATAAHSQQFPLKDGDTVVFYGTASPRSASTPAMRKSLSSPVIPPCTSTLSMPASPATASAAAMPAPWPSASPATLRPVIPP